jgi:hypothetical protein
VDDEPERAGGWRKRRGATRYEPERGIGGQMRGARCKARRIAREQHGGRIECKPPVHPRERFTQPSADETGAAGDEDAFTPQRLPAVARVLEQLVEIAPERMV